jgi:hypothetical protein
MNRKATLSHGNFKLNLPLFFPSISSVKTNFTALEYLKLLKASATKNFLISAYDIFNQEDEKKQEMLGILKELKENGIIILMDSGNYESYWHKDSNWTISTFESILKQELANIYFSFDSQNIKGKSISQITKTCPPPTEIETGEITIGFAHNQVLALADKVLDAVNSGAIKKLVVMSGCDARQKTREYYTEFAKQLPKDTVILTSGCAKYRYNKLKLGDIGGIPRVLDAGQCNDSYSWAFVALKLKEVLKLDDINKLPIVFNIAWYEQKAIIVHLALLYLGIKNTHVGPTLPGFLTPNLLKAVQESFGVQTIKTVEEDMKIFELA